MYFHTASFFLYILERIADGKMEAEPVLELRDVIIPTLACIVRSMQGNTQIQTKYQEFQIVAHTHTGTQSYALGKIAQGKLSARTTLFLTEQPYITRIEEGAPYKSPKMGNRYSTFASSLMSPVWSM